MRQRVASFLEGWRVVFRRTRDLSTMLTGDPGRIFGLGYCWIEPRGMSIIRQKANIHTWQCFSPYERPWWTVTDRRRSGQSSYHIPSQTEQNKTVVRVLRRKEWNENKCLQGAVLCDNNNNTPYGNMTIRIEFHCTLNTDQQLSSSLHDFFPSFSLRFKVLSE